MAQEKAWEKEYSDPTFLTKDSRPQADTLKAFRYLKKEGVSLQSAKILDLGSGAGRNTNYASEQGAEAFGIEISNTAVSIAKEYAHTHKLSSVFIQGDIGKPFSFPDEYFDILLDITSSNSLTESEREMYLKESFRVLKQGGYFIVKALCKDGDANAQYLLKHNPGPEIDTYILPDRNIIERVFSRSDFEDTYKTFAILSLIKKENYTRMNGRVYKRNFWIAYLQKP